VRKGKKSFALAFIFVGAKNLSPLLSFSRGEKSFALAFIFVGAKNLSPLLFL